MKRNSFRKVRRDEKGCHKNRELDETGQFRGSFTVEITISLKLLLLCRNDEGTSHSSYVILHEVNHTFSSCFEIENDRLRFLSRVFPYYEPRQP